MSLFTFCQPRDTIKQGIFWLDILREKYISAIDLYSNYVKLIDIEGEYSWDIHVAYRIKSLSLGGEEHLKYG